MRNSAHKLKYRKRLLASAKDDSNKEQGSQTGIQKEVVSRNDSQKREPPPATVYCKK
jgi:hypothetical protein